MKLLVGTNVVEAPFITVQIGQYTFGCYKNSMRNGKTVAKVNAPNYTKSISIDKINGAVNQYNIVMEYGITQFSDPNYIEKVLSSISGNRKIKLTYGDCNEPSFIYKNEEALITSVTSKVDFSSAKITYNIKAISTSTLATSIVKDWPARNGKPSEIIRNIVQSNVYGLKDIFTGMQDDNTVSSEHLLATDDKKVYIEAKQNMNVFDYLNYLVSCMESITDSKAIYILTVYDTTDPPMNGPYFTVTKVNSTVSKRHNIQEAFEVDVGFPTDTLVTDFQLQNDSAWSILYDYSQEQIHSNYSYLIDNDGELERYETNKLIQDTAKGIVEPEMQAWWNRVTEFPVRALLTVKGLLRPASLMQYVKINSFFYGQKYIASGIYIITKQTDTIDQRGYRTTLELLRIAGDDLYENEKSEKTNVNRTHGGRSGSW